ncbi:lysophospholipid acyltransferase family protein [Rhodopirellula sp. MGV]|uniref:lysophospholipid acyltransferase family protein n=1 Tax=Rhodopirellula sp. MGV TaxID=2023130 RepID=UPI000B970CD1|nr:lysophospholipid acyltransferase family protein [Rhodopirellula sp. MGV]OYP36023.1 hypothetical protein CGZ80_09720 [Rhodopirellula sp. MGV]PNY36619.1 DUF374 domain-containing protein [Rhodopirellula baltica]
MLKRLLSNVLIGYVRLLKWTCRIQPINDPRAAIRSQGQTYIYAALHAQQLATIVPAEPETGALVSRSEDGDLIAKVLELSGVVPIRGSGGARRKGGAAALLGLVHHVQSNRPAYLAVDGPKGPRGCVHPGVALLSQKTATPVIPLCFVPSSRVIVKKSWDRTQVPLPFAKIDCVFGEPVYPYEDESVESHTARIQSALLKLEGETDPQEAIHSCRVEHQSAKTPKAKELEQRLERAVA